MRISSFEICHSSFPLRVLGVLAVRFIRIGIVNEQFFHFIADERWGTHALVFFALGTLVGYGLRQTRLRHYGVDRGKSARVVELSTGVLFAALILALQHGESQTLVEEGYTRLFWVHWRVLFQLTLIALLVSATAIDLELYLIPDGITVTGMLIGIVGATVGGYLHIVPCWVDWNLAIPVIRNPYIPQWIVDHPHWHGFAWSVTGLIVGGGITWLVRIASTKLLGREALGFGDVTLMAMIGSFIGWQPVVLVFLLAPIIGLVTVPIVLFFRGRIAIPYGPFLSAATIVVLLAWKWLWKPTQLLFGHAETLAIFAASIAVAFIAMLGGLRLYRAIPVRKK